MFAAWRPSFEHPPTPQRLPPPLPIVFEQAARIRWEYHVVTLDPREEEPLDAARAGELGAEGWLLASVLDLTGQPHGRLHYHFVRAAQ
jgi:hypothetical protein